MRHFIIITIFFLMVSCAKGSLHVVKVSNDDMPYFDFVKGVMSSFNGDYAAYSKSLKQIIKKYPESEVLNYELARSEFKLGRLDEAMESAQRVIELNPESSKGMTIVGQIYYVKGDFLAARDILEEASKYSDDEDIFILLSRQYVELKQPQKAIEVLTNYLKDHADSYFIYHHIASIYHDNLKNNSMAKRYFMKALENEPDDLNSLSALAQMELEEKNLKKAIEYYKKIEAIAPDDVTVKLKMALIYYEMGDREFAIKGFQDLLQKNPDADKIRYFLGMLHEGMRKDDEAILEYQNVPAKSGYFQDARIRLANLYKLKGDSKKAVFVLKEGASLKPANIVLFELAAVLAENEKDYTESVDILLKAIRAHSKEEKFYVWLGFLYEKRGMRKMALNYMKDVLKINPNNPDALNFIGYSYADDGKKLDEALIMLTKAIQFRPQSGYIMDSLGWAYFKIGDLEKAKFHTSKALKLSPKETVILLHLGEIENKLGNKKEAINYYRMALKQYEQLNEGLSDDEVKLVRERILQLEGN